MKLSVSLPDSDVAALDAYAAEEGLPSRSAALLHAIRQLPRRDLGSAYAEAWEEWSGSDSADAWAATTGDGLDDAPR